MAVSSSSRPAKAVGCTGNVMFIAVILDRKSVVCSGDIMNDFCGGVKWWMQKFHTSRIPYQA
jgi:hypothetical protein